MSQPDLNYLLRIAGNKISQIGFYDVWDVSEFKFLIKSVLLPRECVFTFYGLWVKGKPAHHHKKF